MAKLRFDVRSAGPALLVLGVLLGLANLAGWFFVTRPVVQEYRGLAEASQQRGKIEERREQVTHRTEFLAALKKAEEDLRFLHDEVLSTRSARMIEVQHELKNLADRFEIDLAAVKYSTEMLLDEGLDRFVIDVPLEGNYIALRRFLEAVEDSDKFLLVESVALAKGKEGGNSLQLNITLATYFNAPEELVQRKRELERGKARRRSS